MAELVDALDSGSSRETGGCSSHLDRIVFSLDQPMFSHALIALLCNAPIQDDLTIKEKISHFPILIAVDGGINHCHRLGVQPDLIIGDFDSADPEILKNYSQVSQKRFPKDKDQTDLELAIAFVFHSGIEQIVVFGALQGRTDHTLSNLILLSRYPGKLFLESENERLFVIDKKVKLDVKPGQQISLIPLNGPVTGIYTQGLKWQLENGTLDKQFIGISNEATKSRVMISVGEGDLLCCLNN